MQFKTLSQDAKQKLVRLEFYYVKFICLAFFHFHLEKHKRKENTNSNDFEMVQPS